MRYKYTYAVFPRAYSKSFLAVMILMIRCILYPGAKLFVTSGGKEQASGIMKEKVQLFLKQLFCNHEQRQYITTYTSDDPDTRDMVITAFCSKCGKKLFKTVYTK